MPEEGGLDLGVTPEGERVSELLLAYVRELTSDARLGVRTVVVMGSRARGTWKPWSDTDLLVIAQVPARELPYTREAARINVELRAYRPDEFLKALWRLDVTALEAVHHGIVLHDDSFWPEALREFERVRAFYGLVREELGWRARRWREVCEELGLP